ncbi:MAG TPA: radical SAM protein [Candidatus Kapabacteria bacterium]|nr:radical SAM protein [Candidatus Kapabacteria bacterium]
MSEKDKILNKEKILLMVMPYMAPLCPPMGMSCLKSYLSHHGYDVTAVDVMSQLEIKEAAYKYLETLKKFIPLFRQGYFFNIGIDALKNHFMAYINHTHKQKYIELVKTIVYKNYYVHIDDNQVNELNAVVEQLFAKEKKYLLHLIETVKPTIVGISVYRGTEASSIFAFRLIKEKYPAIKTLMGGAIFSQELILNTPNFESFLEKNPYIDKIFIGEGEILFLKFLRGELPENKKVYTSQDIAHNTVDLNTIELPDFSDFDLSKYPLLPSFTSRGCIYHCSFCTEASFWEKYRKKNAKKIVDDLVVWGQRYNRSIFVLTDCLINPVVTDLANEMIDREINIYWDVYLKVDKFTCNPEYALLWRRGGFYRSRIGIETGSQRVLDLMDKRITIEQSKATLSSLAAAGIKTTTYWAVGHPGETEADFQATLDFITEMQDDIYEAEADPFRYFYSGQGSSDSWSEQYGNSLVYPEEYTDMLMIKTWTLNAEPNREEIYDRLCRFKDHCRKLNISNLDSVVEIYNSDIRWKRLHKNAVPSIAELNKDNYVDDHRNIRQLLNIRNAKTTDKDVDFSF